VVLAINGLMFFTEFGLGWLAQSTGLIADSLDMLADASVYALSLGAIGRAAVLKVRAALISGLLQLALALTVMVDVLHRFIAGSDPLSGLMMAVGLLALLANVTCLRLIAKHRDGEVHMRASWIFSKNDVIANCGVILAGLLVALTGSNYPDLAIGLLITCLVAWGGVQIVREARQSSRHVS
jgi:Co/Zn/Cd efflux system component